MKEERQNNNGHAPTAMLLFCFLLAFIDEATFAVAPNIDNGATAKVAPF